jgi:hypothetical protein
MVSRRSLFATLGLALGLTAAAAAEAKTMTTATKKKKTIGVKHAKVTKPHKTPAKPAA